MRPLLSMLTAWALAGLGAVIGSILGNAGGKRGLFAGAIVGGVAGIGAAVGFLSKLRWIPAEDCRGAFFGGVVGFGIAAPIAVANLHTPITPVLICGLVGAGVILGAGVARRRRQRP